MRKASIYFATAALALMTLAACSNDAGEPDLIGPKDCPDFSATIGGDRSRAVDAAWESGDRIGISGSSRTNVSHVTASGDGLFAVATTGDQIYFLDDKPVTFTAYYPWKEDLPSTSEISADTRVQTGQKAYDFLWAQASGHKLAPQVKFTFAHSMAKVSLTVSRGDDMTYDDIKAARLSFGGIRHTGTFNATDGTTELTGAPVDAWSFADQAVANDAAQTLTFTFIFFPQVFGQSVTFTADVDLPGGNICHLATPIDFTAANGEKDGASARNEWMAGRQYNLGLRLHKTRISLDKCEITPWTNVPIPEISLD